MVNQWEKVSARAKFDLLRGIHLSRPMRQSTDRKELNKTRIDPIPRPVPLKFPPFSRELPNRNQRANLELLCPPALPPPLYRPLISLSPVLLSPLHFQSLSRSLSLSRGLSINGKGFIKVQPSEAAEEGGGGDGQHAETRKGRKRVVSSEGKERKAKKGKRDDFRKTFKEANPDNKSVAVVSTGVRRLPSSDSEWLLDKAWTIVKNSSFLCRRDWVKIISGMEEAYYGKLVGTSADFINEKKLQLKHPCLNTGYMEEYACSRCTSVNLEGSPLIGGKTMSKGRTRTIVELLGAPQWEECNALAKLTVDLSAWSNFSSGVDCEHKPCALNDGLPHPRGKFYAISFRPPHRGQATLSSRRSQSREDLSSSLAEAHMVKV
ncbi:hypothetical protein BHE74_00001876 [Ensete ventricosum]|nr:hypothetical protein BHE74_00001876 [Ensete ventricosum]